MRFRAGMGSLTLQVTCFLGYRLLLRRMAFPGGHRGGARRLREIMIRQLGPFRDWESLSLQREGHRSGTVRMVDSNGVAAEDLTGGD